MSIIKLGKSQPSDTNQARKQVKMTLPLMDFIRLVQGIVIRGKIDGQVVDPPIIEQFVVKKKSLENFSEIALTPYQSSEMFTNKKLEIMIGVPSSYLIYSLYVADCARHNIPYLDENDLVASKSILEV